MRMEGKVALITGGGSGIGRATANLFANEGAKVVVADNNEARAGESAKEISGAGGEAEAVGGDVTDTDDARRMVDTAEQRYGKLNVLVNCAGITHRDARPGASEDEIWDRVIDVNLKGTYLVARHAVDAMKRAGGGSIVNIASMMALVGIAHQSGRGLDPYPASKGGVLQFSRNLAVDSAKDNIRVNSICPGHIRTPMISGVISDPDTVAQLESKYPLGRLGRPEEIAYAALYLASDESSFVTGTYLVVDGGFTAQ